MTKTIIIIMTRYIYHIFTLITALLLTTSARGAISAESTKWTKTEILENTEITFTKNHTGEIIISGIVTIDACTLTIRLGSGYPANTNKVIRAEREGGFERMFYIKNGGKLAIEGRDDNSRIILDGGARFDGPDDKRLLSISDAGVVTVYGCTKKILTQELIDSNTGSLFLNWVTLQNTYSNEQFLESGSTSYGGAIHIRGKIDDDDTHRTVINNCIIQNCADNDGGAIAIRMNNNENPKDTYPANTRVTLTNTEIRYCYTTGTSGGTIRANGRTINDVVLNNVNIHHNYTEASAAALLWNGAGSDKTDLQINDKCIFHHNVAKTNGGALNISATTSFSGQVTIENNYAGAHGGGINIHTYNGGNMPKKNNYDFTYTFPTGLVIRNNHSRYGGGIAYDVDNFKIYANWDTDPHTGVHIRTTLDLNGAQIYDNTASSNGGGIWLANNLETKWEVQGEATAEIIVNLNEGSIRNNVSEGGHGGGIYLYKTDISRSKTGSTLSLESNVAQKNGKNGGGIYIEDGKSINLDGVITSIKDNKASNGGAIYLNGTSGVQVTMGTTTMESNEVTGSGGAVFVKGGTLLLNRATVQNNSAAAKGGAIYIDGGEIDIRNTVTLSSNTAGGDGGAVYVDGGQFSASSSITINSNSAGGDGGAVYVTGTDSERGNISINGNSGNSNKAVITGNYSAGDGGAFYVNNGDITMGLTELSGNGKDASSVVRTIDGGAIALKNGKFSFADGSEIKDNHATRNGGGLFISNDSATSIRCVGGSYINNSAGFGGGLYASGPITLQFAANMQSNRAINGGGMYLTDDIDMTFGVNEKDLKLSGLIVGNEAKGEGENGVGGGVYLAKGILRFALSDDFKDLGIYNNSASYEAADIYSSGSQTTVHLPNISGMNLTGFDVPGSDLYWVRDFSEKRYETLLRNNQDIADLIVHFDGAPTLVLASEQCLDLGYDLVFVTLIPVGLDAFDNAAVTISYPHKTTGDPTQYRKVVLHGTEPQIVGLPSNHWQFVATPWSFTYQIPTYDPPHAAETSGTDRKDYILIKRNHNQEIKISFSQNNAQKGYVTHDVLVVNPMRPGGQVN